eukprot:SAG11_NODE_2490_length_3294_cov_3.906416_3_plen_136_part_00
MHNACPFCHAKRAALVPQPPFVARHTWRLQICATHFAPPRRTTWSSGYEQQKQPMPTPQEHCLEQEMVAFAITGTLQEGFWLRQNLDHGGVPARFVGWALCRGLKAYLDVKEPGSREWYNNPLGTPSLVCITSKP